MFDRYTDLARRVVSQAVKAAERRGATAIEPEHLLFAILELDHGVAITALANAGVHVATALKQLVVWMPESSTPTRDLEVSATLREVLDAADRVSRDMGHSYLGTEHLLVSLLTGSPVGSMTYLMLRQQLRLDPDRIRADIESMLSEPTESALPIPSPPRPPPIDGALLAWKPTSDPEQYVILGDRGTGSDALVIAEDQPDAERLLEALANASRKAGYTRLRAVPTWAWIHVTPPTATDLLDQVRKLAAQTLVCDLRVPKKPRGPSPDQRERGRASRTAKPARPST